ncbi:MAG: deoxyribonuclease IV [Firmicutes bacterium HGW-Firmicutes-10]|jgi:deoxyribonuclease-4|nr:MAG: deoxyribonuclease IV [Firmicutes bacterium HGW-Firmicutes-10]
MIIGSHVSLSSPDYFLGSVKEALSYNANALMIYTGAPQNTFRKSTSDFKISEAKMLLSEAEIPAQHIIVHAPYIINLANTLKPETFDLAVDFLKKEIDRTRQIGAKIIVLHPGSHVNAGEDIGLNRIVEGLNLALADNDDIEIALETMAGKGSELGYRFEHLAYIKEAVDKPHLIKVCMDTCHMSDAGYDVFRFNDLLDEFDKIIGLQHLRVIHLNDSKNEPGAKKDRHANLGYGQLGFDFLHMVASHPRLASIPKILETPYVDDLPPYGVEIEMLRSGVFTDWISQ